MAQTGLSNDLEGSATHPVKHVNFPGPVLKPSGDCDLELDADR